MFQITKNCFFLNLFIFIKKKKKKKINFFFYNSLKMFYTLKKKNAYLASKPKNIFSIFFSTVSYNNNENLNNLKK